jgi:SAM-dependent methyltransferase
MGAQHRIFPETGAGGFTRIDGTVEFYNRVRALVTTESIVVDVGAGRGRLTEDPVDYRRNLRTLRGAVAKVIGVDIDPAVLSNDALDEAYVLQPGGAFPLPTGSVDVVISDFTFEHVREPGAFSQEIERILKPNGWLCARTPNKWGYIGLGARLVPNRLHTRALRSLQPHKAADDTFDVAYRLNTRRSLHKYFTRGKFVDCTYAMDSEPAYFGDFAPAWRVIIFLNRFLPVQLKSVLFIFMRRTE